MPETTWKLTLKALGATGARKLTRDVTALTSALNGLSSASTAATTALARVGGGTTAGRLRAQTTLIRAQTQAIKEQRAASVTQARADRSAAATRAQEMRQQISAHKAVARSQAQAVATARRAQAQAAGGRTRLDVGAALTGRTRMDVGAPAGAAGRTRVDVDALGGRTRAEGPTAGEFQARARALQIAHNTKSAAIAERAASRNAAITARAQRREEAATARHYRNIHASAQRNARALERVNAQAARNRARVTERGRQQQFRAMQAEQRSSSALLGTVGGVALGAVAALAGIATAFAGVSLSAAQAVIEVAAFRESSLVALEAVLGSSQAAGRQFRNAITVANQTPLDTQDVIRQTQSFAIAGFGEREIAPLVAASADLGAAFGQRSSEGFALALSQIRAAGRLQGQELLQLSNANVSRSAVLDSIARQMNLSGATPEARRRAAQQAISKRRVSSAVGEQAALDAVRGRLDQGGQLGSFARRQSETLTGAISNARNAVFNLLVGIDFGNIPGIVAFKNALLQITAALSTGSPAATALRAGITGAANAVGRLFARVTPANIQAGLGFAGDAVRRIGGFITTYGPIARSFFNGLGPGFTAGIAPLRALFAQLLSGGGPSAGTIIILTRAASGLGQVLGFAAGSAIAFVGAIGTFATVTAAALTTVAGLVGSVLVPIRTAFVTVGSNIVSGIIDGIRGGIGSMTSAVTGLGSSAVAAARAALGIRSPSRVFASLIGAQIPAGIAAGVNAGAPVANDAVANIVSPRVPRLGGGGGPVSITIQVDGAAQPQETARAVRAELEDALGGIFGQWAEASP